MSFFANELRRVFVLAALGLLVLAAGCGQHDQITSYTVRKPELVDPTLVAKTSTAPAAATDNQTLGLIVPVGDMGWFFKLTGDMRAVEQEHQEFLEFIQSLKFSPPPDAKPSWTLPSGWKELPGREMRFATIQIAADSGPPLELSVIPLPNTSKDTQKYVLDNVNRWRQQLRLPPIGAGDLAGSTKTLKVDGHEATLVSLVGKGSGQMSGAPFAPFAGGSGPMPADHPPVPTGKSGGSGDLRYTMPPEWSPGKPNAISLAAFKVIDGDSQAEITVSTAGGQWLSNVNRWRGQLGLSPIDEPELAKLTKKIETLGTSGDYVEIVGPENAAKRETILGVQAEAGRRMWFVKLRGDSQLAAREKSRFETFVKSLNLP